MPSPPIAANENRPPPAAGFTPGGIPIIGFIGEGGLVTITDPDWLPAPRRVLELVDDGRPAV